ncbi:uncharacterized protein LOC121051460 isoform X2 [Rosa chinensis]|uniref:uncharacterized protein LOC121051460 isoform X2 n=1 Tax=Rosa chinensis TaxID=74649 RepID=UPI001AD8D9F4|nr:uncharacterized protein LOC121051460 isoform X2 [Rosa chinensis]
MDLEIRSFGASELFNSSPKCSYFSYNGGESAGSCSVGAAASADRFDSVDAETSLIRAVYLDSKAELLTQTKRLAGGDVLDRATASKLLHLCCNFDSAECASALLGGELGTVPLVNEFDDSGKSPLHTAASAHASRCAEVLLKKHARTDLRTKDGQAQLALELSLSDTRMDLNWNPNDFSIEDLVIHMSEKDLSTVKLLSEKTKEIADVAYGYAVKGRVASLTALLIVAAEKVNDSVLELRDSESGTKEKLTIYEWLIREALSMGGRTALPLRAAKRASTATEGENSERRKLVLREIELLQLFGAVAQSSGGGDKKVTSPLIRAAQGGDEAVIQLLLKTNIDVNDADADGNSALHWILKLSRLLCPQQIKIVLLLIDHGARVSQRNRLGLTAFHIAAGNGNSEALEVLLLEDPVGVQYRTEMKETPLFFAVKNESKECTELLLTWGANSEVLNLRRQRAIDLATSQDMRYILLNPTTVSLINHAFPNQHKCTALELTDEDTANERNVNSSTKAEVCKYFDSHRGCVRGAKCFYAHCEEESRKVKEGADRSHFSAAKLLKHKIFVGGLPPSVDSDDLGKFCEEEFGSVDDAIVIVTQTENKIQSRGFGFVTFREEKSASEAMQAHYITMRGKKVEIKSLIPKLVLGAEFEKMSPQQRQQDKNIQNQLPQQKSNENIMEGDNPEQGSWADRLVLGQPVACSTEPQVTKSSEDPSTPTWLKVFKKWFPGFLQGLSKHSNYALSSLKADFRAKFGLELDHSSVGYSKLSDFVKCFSDLCTVEILPICKRGTPTHVILRPKFSRPQRRLLPTLRTPHTLSLSALLVKGGDTKCLLDLSSGDCGDSKCLQDHSKCFQDLSVNNGSDSKCFQNLTIESISDTKCLQDISADNAADSKCLQDLSLDFSGDSNCIEDLSICNAGEKFGSSVTSHGQEKPSSGYPEMNSAEDKGQCVHLRFLQFLKPDPLFYGQKETDVLAGETDNEKGQCSAGDKGSINIRDPRRHLVLESLSKKWSKSYFLREFDFYKIYKERLSVRRCFACNQQKMLWANFPCKHLLWCTDCKLRAIEASGLFPHKCVLCDTEVQKMDLVLPFTSN